LTSCEIPLNPNLTKEDTIIKAMKGFGIDTSTSHLYTLELWIEHKEHKDFVKSIYESWEEYKNTPNVKFHLYRKREPKIEKKYVKLGEDFSRYIPDESKIKKVDFLRPNYRKLSHDMDLNIRTIFEQQTKRLSRIVIEPFSPPKPENRLRLSSLPLIIDTTGPAPEQEPSKNKKNDSIGSKKNKSKSGIFDILLSKSKKSIEVKFKEIKDLLEKSNKKQIIEYIDKNEDKQIDKKEDSNKNNNTSPWKVIDKSNCNPNNVQNTTVIGLRMNVNSN